MISESRKRANKKYFEKNKDKIMEYNRNYQKELLEFAHNVIEMYRLAQ